MYVGTALSIKSKLIIRIAQLLVIYFICPAGLPPFCSTNDKTPKRYICTKYPCIQI